MQQSLAQLLYDISGNVADWAHPIPHQIAIASVVMIGLIMLVLSAVFPLTSQEPEPDELWLDPWAPQWGDLTINMPAPTAASAQQGEGGVTGSDGIHGDHSLASSRCGEQS